MLTALVLLSITSGRLAFADQRFEYRSFEDIARLFVELHYTEATWNAGLRIVPRAHLSRIPERWRANVAARIDVQTKKEVFFRLMAPLLLRSNEEIAENRTRLIALKGDFDRTPEDAEWVRSLARRNR